MPRPAKKMESGRSSSMLQSMPEIDVVEESGIGPDAQGIDYVLRTLARWLLSASRSTASPEWDGAANVLQKSVDVVRRAKVMSKGR